MVTFSKDYWAPIIIAALNVWIITVLRHVMGIKIIAMHCKRQITGPNGFWKKYVFLFLYCENVFFFFFKNKLNFALQNFLWGHHENTFALKCRFGLVKKFKRKKKKTIILCLEISFLINVWNSGCITFEKVNAHMNKNSNCFSKFIINVMLIKIIKLNQRKHKTRAQKIFSKFATLKKRRDAGINYSKKK